MKFSKLKKPIKQVKKPKEVYWTKKRCELLAANFYILDEIELRKLFGGRSYSVLSKKASALRRNGWRFKYE